MQDGQHTRLQRILWEHLLLDTAQCTLLKRALIHADPTTQNSKLLSVQSGDATCDCGQGQSELPLGLYSYW